ncbi:MAG: segregation and condensation protein A [Lachnospirales bacterium]
MEKFNIKLENFDGPFHLLYHLVEKNQMDIWDIPINKLTEEYLQYIEILKNEVKDEGNKRLEELSDFIYLASKLIYIKSKMLLPIKIDEEDPREELIEKLNEYKMFKEISEEFKGISFELYTKKPEQGIFLAIKDYEQITIDEVLQDVSLKDLYAAFKKLMINKENKVDQIRSTFSKVTRPTFSIEEKRERILNLIYLHEVVVFQDIFNIDSPKIEIVITFLAMLDLIKKGEIFVRQDDSFDVILLEKKGA